MPGQKREARLRARCAGHPRLSLVATKTWMAGTSPAMMEEGKLRWHPMHRADLVAVDIAQIGEVHFARRAFAYARRIFASGAAMGEARRVPGVGLLGGFSRKPNGAAVRRRRRLAVDRLRHREHAGLGEVENAVAVDPGRPDAKRAEQGVIERLGLFQVVGADHHV